MMDDMKDDIEDLDARLTAWDEKLEKYKWSVEKLLFESMRDIIFEGFKKVEEQLLLGYGIEKPEKDQSEQRDVDEVDMSSEMVSVVNKRGSQLPEPTKTTSVHSSQNQPKPNPPAQHPFRQPTPIAGPSNSSRRRNRSESRGRGNSNASRGSGRGGGSHNQQRERSEPTWNDGSINRYLSEDWNARRYDQPQLHPTDVYNEANSIRYSVGGE